MQPLLATPSSDAPGTYKAEANQCSIDTELLPSLDQENISLVKYTVCTHTLICHTGRNYTHVALRIPEGDRPCLEDIDVRKADGLSEMVELMKSLWDEDAAKRKTFKGPFYLRGCCIVAFDWSPD